MGHYYQHTDSGVIPMHFVEMSTRPGELRPTRITDVKKWWKEGKQVFPSVTTILNVLDKPALLNWKIDKHLEQVWINDAILEEMSNSPDCGVEDFIKEIKRRAEMEMDKAPSAGSDLHKSIELYGAGELAVDHKDFQMCVEVMRHVGAATGSGNWRFERNFVADGFGGQIDLSNDYWMIDFKTKQTADKFKPGKMVYDEHTMQLAAYRLGLQRPQARCANVFICLEDGQIDFHEHKEDALQKGLDLFSHALAIWQIQNGFNQLRIAA